MTKDQKINYFKIISKELIENKLLNCKNLDDLSNLIKPHVTKLTSNQIEMVL